MNIEIPVEHYQALMSCYTALKGYPTYHSNTSHFIWTGQRRDALEKFDASKFDATMILTKRMVELGKQFTSKDNV